MRCRFVRGSLRWVGVTVAAAGIGSGMWGCVVHDEQPPTGGDPLARRTICIDPGHGGTAETDHFRVGPSGEREEWINLRVALELRSLLQDRGAEVVMTRTADVPVALEARAQVAKDRGAEVFLSIHHNATADETVNFPIVYFHGAASENRAGAELGRLVATFLRAALFDGQGPACVISDRAIFPTKGASVLRNSYGIPGVIGEASFFSNAEEEQRLKNPEANRTEARAYVRALEAFFKHPVSPIADRGSVVELEPFAVLEGGDRMKEEALKWKTLYEEGLKEMGRGEAAALATALESFTRSIRAFPDSYLAKACHERRAEILDRTGHPAEAATARLRAGEHYVEVD